MAFAGPFRVRRCRAGVSRLWRGGELFFGSPMICSFARVFAGRATFTHLQSASGRRGCSPCTTRSRRRAARNRPAATELFRKKGSYVSEIVLVTQQHNSMITYIPIASVSRMQRKITENSRMYLRSSFIGVKKQKSHTVRRSCSIDQTTGEDIRFCCLLRWI